MTGSPRRTLGPYGPRDDDGPPAPVRGPFDPYGAPRAAAPRRAAPHPGAPYPGEPRPGEPRPGAARRAPARLDRTGGADGNERLTAAAGAVLLVLFAAEGLTILSIHQLITVHFFLGMLLIGPVLLKAATVCYRFVRYYTGALEYRRKGPPPRCSGCSARWCWVLRSACWAPG